MKTTSIKCQTHPNESVEHNLLKLSPTFFKSFSLVIFVILLGCSSTKSKSSKNEDLVKSYINARNNYDIETIKTLVKENYRETFIDGNMEIENKGQLTKRILWGKTLDSNIKLLEIKSAENMVITIEEYTNFLDVALKRKSRKFKISYTFSDDKIQNQVIDTLPDYYQVLKFNAARYEEFVKYCKLNKLDYNYFPNEEDGIRSRKVLEKYKRDSE